MKTDSFCAVCDKSRDRDANRWSILVIGEDRNGHKTLTIKHWNEYDARRAWAGVAGVGSFTTVAVCGEAHALILIQRYLENGSFARPMPLAKGENENAQNC